MIYLWTKQHSSWVLYWWNLIEPLDVCWWHLCVLSKCTLVAKYTRSVSGWCRIAWNYFQLQQNCLYDGWECKKHGHPIADTVKSVSRYKYLGIVLDIELSDNKDIQRQMQCQYEAVNKLRASFSQFWNAVKNVLIRSFCRSMYTS